MKDKGNQAGWGFWLGWVVATTVGMGAGFIMMFLIYGLLEALLGRAVTDNLIEIKWLGNMILGIGFGIGVGIPQWIVLRGRITGAGWWVLASATGYGIYLIMEDYFIDYSDWFSFVTLLRLTGVAALGGAVMGTLQWLVLRRQVFRAGWWVLASTVGWVLSTAVGEALERGINDEESFMPLVVRGVVLGAVTGGALVWLLRQPVPEAQLE